jgi:hypothetical protein
LPNNKGNEGIQRITYIILGGSLAIIAFVSIFIIVTSDNEDKMNFVNIIVPVVATWIGTILAFYYGKQNFDAANEQVRKMVDKLTPEELAQKPVSSIMRSLREISCFSIPKDTGEGGIKISELKKATEKVSRLPLLNAEGIAKYMIHESSLNKYLVENPDGENKTLADFAGSFKCGLNNGFVVVSESATIAEAKKKMQEISTCQDIFITKGGKTDEALSGWISNIRLEKYLKA